MNLRSHIDAFVVRLVWTRIRDLNSSVVVQVPNRIYDQVSRRIRDRAQEEGNR